MHICALPPKPDDCPQATPVTTSDGAPGPVRAPPVTSRLSMGLTAAEWPSAVPCVHGVHSHPPAKSWPCSRTPEPHQLSREPVPGMRKAGPHAIIGMTASLHPTVCGVLPPPLTWGGSPWRSHHTVGKGPSMSSHLDPTRACASQRPPGRPDVVSVNRGAARPQTSVMPHGTNRHAENAHKLQQWEHDRRFTDF